jgi:hypothetical protein
MARPVFPNVRCGFGHPDEPGYAVCSHVVNDGASVARVIEPSPSTMGQISCERKGHGPGDIWLVCATCVRSKGWVIIQEAV